MRDKIIRNILKNHAMNLFKGIDNINLEEILRVTTETEKSLRGNSLETVFASMYLLIFNCFIMLRIHEDDWKDSFYNFFRSLDDDLESCDVVDLRVVPENTQKQELKTVFDNLNPREMKH